VIILAVFLILFLYLVAEKIFGNQKTKVISLHVVLDSECRIVYTGSEVECKNHITSDYKLIELTGII
jgi:hypothetical protein